MPPDIKLEYERLVRLSAETAVRYRAETRDRALCALAGACCGGILTEAVRVLLSAAP